METSLHRQLKEIYASGDSRIEVPLDRYRIDVVSDGHLVEIQHGSLAAIRDKVQSLLKNHSVIVVKPIVIRKRLFKLAEKGGPLVSKRLSPKKGCPLDLFDELVYFTRVFPHPSLRLEVPLVDIEEYRYPGHGKRRRRRENDHQVEDQKLGQVHQTLRFSRGSDLIRLMPKNLPKPFHTGHLAQKLQIKRWVAQKIAYCFREMGISELVGKQGNTQLYKWAS